MFSKAALILIFGLLLPQFSLQIFPKSKYADDKANKGETDNGKPVGLGLSKSGNFKAALIIVCGVFFSLTFLYGTRCYYIFKMYFCEKKSYTKMSFTNV